MYRCEARAPPVSQTNQLGANGRAVYFWNKSVRSDELGPGSRALLRNLSRLERYRCMPSSDTDLDPYESGLVSLSGRPGLGRLESLNE